MFRYLYLGQSTQAIAIGGNGELLEVDVNVIQAFSGGGSATSI